MLAGLASYLQSVLPTDRRLSRNFMYGCPALGLAPPDGAGYGTDTVLLAAFRKRWPRHIRSRAVTAERAPARLIRRYTGDRRSPKPFGRITQDTRVILASFFDPICGDDHPCISRSVSLSPAFWRSFRVTESSEAWLRRRGSPSNRQKSLGLPNGCRFGRPSAIEGSAVSSAAR